MFIDSRFLYSVIFAVLLKLLGIDTLGQFLLISVEHFLFSIIFSIKFLFPFFETKKSLFLDSSNSNLINKNFKKSEYVMIHGTSARELSF